MIKTIQIDTTCCDKEMHYTENGQNLMHPNAETKSWVCQECGRYITIIDDYMEDEELENLKENGEFENEAFTNN